MPQLCEAIISPALTGQALEVGDRAFEQGNTPAANDRVATLEGQVQALLALLQGQQAAGTPVAPVEVVVEEVKAPAKKATAEK